MISIEDERRLRGASRLPQGGLTFRVSWGMIKRLWGLFPLRRRRRSEHDKDEMDSGGPTAGSDGMSG